MRTGFTPRAAFSQNAQSTPPPTVARLMRAQPWRRVAGKVSGIESMATRSPSPGVCSGASHASSASIILTDEARRMACDSAL